MRIRRSASRFLGSAYSMPVAPSLELPPPTPPNLASGSTSLESHGACGISSTANSSNVICEISISPWDLPVSNPQMVDNLLDSYYVEHRASYICSASMSPIFLEKKNKPAMVVASRDKAQLKEPKKTTMKKEKTPKRAAMKTKGENNEGEAIQKAKVKKQEGKEEALHDLKCNKNDGKGLYCQQPVGISQSLCESHLKKKRSYLKPKSGSAKEEEKKVIVMALAAPSKPSGSSKTREKKPTNHFNATEGFYYYTGFGPLRIKRRCRVTTHDISVPTPKQEEVEVSQAKVEVDDGTNDGVVAYDVVTSHNDNDDIVGIDEGSSGDEFFPSSSSHSNISTKWNKNPRKHKRKPMKARSLKSLL